MPLGGECFGVFLEDSRSSPSLNGGVDLRALSYGVGGGLSELS